MKVVIVAKTRRGGGACVGAITWEGRSVRLIAPDAATNARAGLEYGIGEVWEIEFTPELRLVPPHIENVLVHSARRVGAIKAPEEFISARMPPVAGEPARLFDGLLQTTEFGAFYIAKRTGIPSHSTRFWIPDRPLHMSCDAKRIRYRYGGETDGRTLVFVGFQDPVECIPAGTLVRISLAHWWRPKEQPDEEERCYAQLSGWFLSPDDVSHCIENEREALPESSFEELDHPAAPARPEHRLQIERARDVLKQVFGFADFLPLQSEIISNVLRRRDTLAIMPTGGGKSLCYQLPALLFEGLTVVVSPLIALMQDQVMQLREAGVEAAFLNSSLRHQEYVAVTHRAREGKVKVLYAAPETLLRPETVVLIEQCNLACLAVDEAHCISEWGHDFRPEYRQVQSIRKRFPGAACIALTATATPRVRADIQRVLSIPPSSEFVASFNRPNLFISADARRDGLAQTLEFLERHSNESGIIYCSTRRQVDELAGELAHRGRCVYPYHAGLDDARRTANQNLFIRADAAVMVATVAFGMGINKSNVRFVLHYNLPKDLESYYQEIGRAGRDGLPAECLLLHSRADALTARRWIEQGNPAERPGRQARLEAMLRFAEAVDCRRVPLLAYFGETLDIPCGHCDNCLSTASPGPTVDVTEAAQQFLTTVQATREWFGPAHIIDILRGSQSQKLIAKAHDKLPTHGAGARFAVREWREFSRQFVSQGLLEQDLQYGSLRLTAKGRDVLSNGTPVLVPLTLTGPAPSIQPAMIRNEELFEVLRTQRRTLAEQAGVPPYMIFSDRALTEMAAALPVTESQFLAINGVGQTKLERYGEVFLDLIRSFCKERGIEPPAPNVTAPPAPTQWLTVKQRHHESAELLADGRPLDEIATRAGVKRGTVIQHLQRCYDEGRALDPERLLAASALPEADRTRVLAAFAELGFERLAPIFDTLGRSVPYEELHLLRLYLHAKKTPNRET